MRDLAVCILAAGKGKRMGNPDQAKVLTPLAGRPLLGYVLDCALELRPAAAVVIAGHQREAVAEYTHTQAPSIGIAIQDQQLGTGHAVLQAKTALHRSSTDVLILSGDVPLLTSATLRTLVQHHSTSKAVLTILTTRVDDPTGYGRILRDGKGALAGIVEHKDATDEQLRINEINSGIYLVDAEALFAALDEVGNANAQGEYYLTDIARILLDSDKLVEGLVTDDPSEVHGINTPVDLARAAEILAERTVA